MAFVEQGRRLALARDRPDLARQLESTETQLTEHTWPVAVVGEFKRGKSTLVNALLRTAVCPVDADIVTAVPTLVRYGETPSATAYAEPSEGTGPLVAEPVSISALAAFVSEAGNPGNRRRLRSVEIRLRRRLLRNGLALVDTPGVGGLDSAHGVITLSALDVAAGMLFVTDASQELTRPEMDFLETAIRRCPIAACVVTKIDLYPEWRRIVELNQAHLRAADIDVDVIPVSSFLRLRSAPNVDLTEESGFTALLTFLEGRVEAQSRVRAAATAAKEVEFVAAQLAGQVEAESKVVARPDEAAAVVSSLESRRQRTAVLSSPTASWRQTLTDRFRSLKSDIMYDLEERLRDVARQAEEIIANGDPKESWPDVESWLRRAVLTAVVANYDEMSRRTEDLVVHVTNKFDLEAETPINLTWAAPTDALRGIAFSTTQAFVGPTGRINSTLLVARGTSFVPMLMFGVASHLMGIMIAGPLGLALGVGVGAKVVKDERTRQLMFRRQHAKGSANRYVSDVQRKVGKECRDGLDLTYEALRDEFTARAAAIHRSTTTAMTSVRSAQLLAPDERPQRASELRQAQGEIQALQRKAAVIWAAAIVDAPSSPTGDDRHGFARLSGVDDAAETGSRGRRG